MAIAMGAAKRTILGPANIVTMSRIALAPFVIAAIYWFAPAWWVLIFGFLAMITDKVDGYLARRHGVTDLGTFLDPIADKVMVLGAFAILVLLGWVWWLPVALIAIREFAMSSWRSKLARRGISVPARKLAKYKTWFQSLTVAVALVPGVVDHARWSVTTLLWVSVVITWITFVQYLIDGSSKVNARGSNAV
jgi:CDP-diacylglycerol--glycerol-3-phosphate 3-phosphatidyltransferase